jgi:hypothetical protein
MTDLTPESEALLAHPPGYMGVWHQSDGRREDLRKRLAAIEAAAIARYREGLVEVVVRNMHSDDWDGAGGCECESVARRLLALDAPEAQCRCGHAQRVHVTDVDWDEHSGCTSTGCDCRLFDIPETQS